MDDYHFGFRKRLGFGTAPDRYSITKTANSLHTVDTPYFPPAPFNLSSKVRHQLLNLAHIPVYPAPHPLHRPFLLTPSHKTTSQKCIPRPPPQPPPRPQSVTPRLPPPHQVPARLNPNTSKQTLATKSPAGPTFTERKT